MTSREEKDNWVIWNGKVAKKILHPTHCNFPRKRKSSNLHSIHTWHHWVLCACLQIFFHSFFPSFLFSFMNEKNEIFNFHHHHIGKINFPNFHFTTVRQSLTIFTWMSKLKMPPSYVLHKAGNQILKFTRWLWKISTDPTLTFLPDLWYDRERECVWVERRGKYLQRIFTITFAKEKKIGEMREKSEISREKMGKHDRDAVQRKCI